MDAMGQGPSHGGAGLESAQDSHRFDGGKRQFRRHIVGNAGQANDLDLESLPRRHRRLEIGAAVVLQANRERLAGHRLPDCFGMQRKLVSKRRSDEVGTVRIEAFLDQQIDVAEIDHADVDGHLLGLASALPAFDSPLFGLHTIQSDSIWIPIGAHSMKQSNAAEAKPPCGAQFRAARQRRH